MADPKQWKNLVEFIFNTPLYSPIEMEAAWDAPMTSATPRRLILGESFRVDGHCVACKRWATFSRMNPSPWHKDDDLDWAWVARIQPARWHLKYSCSRNPSHLIEIYTQRDGATISKIGQTPSLADTVIDEARKYAKALDDGDRKELMRAIGLATHGVGIGSFVYLRRLFEKVIARRFAEHAKEEGWGADAMNGLRMEEKIALLAKYLPRFLVENRHAYGMLSAGIHELTEDDCLAMFRPLKTAIVFMLEEDEQARQREAAKAAAEAELKVLQQTLANSSGPK
jgi:hypothetical protein